MNFSDEDSFEKNDDANEFAKEENLLYKADAFWNENNSSSEFSAKFV